MDQPDLVRRFLDHRDMILGFIYGLTMDYDVAEEVFQEVATSILQEGHRTVSIDNFRAWARQVARNRVADYYRKNARRSAVERPAGAMADVIAQAFAENEVTPQSNQNRMKALLECLARLTGRPRELIDGFYRDQLSLKQLAARLAWKENSVKVALSRARKMLADCVAVKMRSQQTG
jgi:RNA polymerase sigma-70 factor (ECF subfamily)